MVLDERAIDVLRVRLFELCERSLDAVGYTLVDLEYLRDPQGWVLRIYIDVELPGPTSGERPGSAITHQDCERASRHLGAVLDVEDPINEAYRLEVSSPGLQRPLRRERDFDRFAGRRARIQLRQPLDGRKNFNGRIVAAAGGVVDLEVDGVVVKLPLAHMRRARLEVEL